MKLNESEFSQKTSSVAEFVDNRTTKCNCSRFHQLRLPIMKPPIVCNLRPDFTMMTIRCGQSVGFFVYLKVLPPQFFRYISCRQHSLKMVTELTWNDEYGCVYSKQKVIIKHYCGKYKIIKYVLFNDARNCRGYSASPVYRNFVPLEFFYMPLESRSAAPHLQHELTPPHLTCQPDDRHIRTLSPLLPHVREERGTEGQSCPIIQLQYRLKTTEKPALSVPEENGKKSPPAETAGQDKEHRHPNKKRYAGCRSSTESYPEFARIGLRENPGKNLNQVTCPDRDSNPGHLVSRPDALTVIPQASGAVRSGEQEGYGNGILREIRRSPKCRCKRHPRRNKGPIFYDRTRRYKLHRCFKSCHYKLKSIAAVTKTRTAVIACYRQPME
ncbi:hypothetical protein ANN_24587 [Periplaneta americana]|uniref:Uncharacterized protein n=1 Tax=Periplaneta americana TaxID=6978 RepID=A0ABQ8S3M2_PERAM|nr:hypothetical protein ANN_24587 [Periplaneta americana]